jgi:hypothetical protein
MLRPMSKFVLPSCRVILGLAERLERRHMHIARSAMADHGAAAKNWAAASMRCMGDRGGASTNSMRELFEKRRDRALLMAPTKRPRFSKQKF